MVVTLSAILGRDSEAVAVPTADGAIALVDDWLGSRLQEGAVIESRSVTLVRTTDEYRDATTFGVFALGPNSKRLPVWLVTFSATVPGETRRYSLRYVVEAKTGKFLVESLLMPSRNLLG
jgi:hypothetical protein